ncbi:MAG: hypothetical protein R8K20_06960 [Gallionellaceae bacterium]
MSWHQSVSEKFPAKVNEDLLEHLEKVDQPQQIFDHSSEDLIDKFTGINIGDYCSEGLGSIKTSSSLMFLSIQNHEKAQDLTQK